MTKTEIIQTLLSNKQKLHDEFGLKRIGLFGSYAKDLQTNESDIDLIISFQSGMKKYQRFLSLHEFLESKFNKKIELITTESVSDFFLKNIQNETINVAIN